MNKPYILSSIPLLKQLQHLSHYNSHKISTAQELHCLSLLWSFTYKNGSIKMTNTYISSCALYDIWRVATLDEVSWTYVGEIYLNELRSQQMLHGRNIIEPTDQLLCSSYTGCSTTYQFQSYDYFSEKIRN